MEFLVELLEFLDSDMEKPTLYGWFHILWLFLTVGTTVLLCKLFPRGTTQQVHRVILVITVAVSLLELYKQINFTFSVTDGTIKTDYQWYAFPFQFCSTPMYAGLLACLFRKGKVHRAMCAFLATYAVFAGVCVMLYPSDVFIDTIGINVQTMFCHGSMIVLGVYLLYTKYVFSEHKTILKAIPVFAGAVCIAAIANEIAYVTGLLETETFNMFFISPHCDPSLPVYSLVQAVVPYPWCLVIYILVFSLAAYIILLLAILAQKLFIRNKKYEKEKKIPV